MRHLGMVVLSLIFCFIAFSPAVQSQEKSDYETIQSFKQSLAEIQKDIEKAATVQECVDVSSRIDDLEKQYADNVDLLDKALYPDGYKGKITSVRTQLRMAQEKLGIIETQFARISDLESQVKSLTGKVDSLTGENANLLKQVTQMGEEVKGSAAGMASNKSIIDSLTRLVGRLRENIRQRDQMIFALVDSLFLQYDKSVSSMKDVEKQGLTAKLERRNVFTNIRKSIEDNIAFLQSTALTSKDLVSMLKEQQRFSSQWKAFGSKLQGLYEPGKKGARQIQDVDGLLDEWGKRADASFWRGLNLVFSERSLPVKPFNSGAEFKTNLLSYIDSQIKDVSGTKKDESVKQYGVFFDSVWTNELESAWLPLLVDSGKISASDKEDIENQVASWGSAVNPSHVWIWILIIVVVVVVLFFALRKKTPPAAPKPAQS